MTEELPEDRAAGQAEAQWFWSNRPRMIKTSFDSRDRPQGHSCGNLISGSLARRIPIATASARS